MSNIFISYRREDSDVITESIYYRLIKKLGKKRVFMDTEAINAGETFKTRIESQIKKSDILLVVIGKNWLKEIQTRLENQSFDYVRFELETAYSYNLEIIPLLVNGALIPEKELLPPSIQFLPDKNAKPIRKSPDFKNDVDDLVKGILEYTDWTFKFSNFLFRYRALLLIGFLSFALGLSLLGRGTEPKVLDRFDAYPNEWGAKSIFYKEENPNHRSKSIQSVQYFGDKYQFEVILKPGYRKGWFIALHLNRSEKSKYHVKYWVGPKGLIKSEKLLLQ